MLNKVEWIRKGVKEGWCSLPVCEYHDGLPVSEQESRQTMEGSTCILIMRLYSSDDERKAVESFSPFVFKDVTCYLEGDSNG